MKLPYREISGILRPIIQVRFHYKKIFVIDEALIDSGADWCIFDAGLLDILKLPVNRKINFQGIGREKLTGFKSKVSLIIADKKLEIDVIFSPDLGPFSYGVLGQKGFFDNFRICFDKLRLQVEIT